jgi:flavin-dependent dehydrogenase
MSSGIRQTDVFVVGGGPAGLAAAIAARNCGFAVMLADSAQPPIDKACGEGIMPDGLAALKKLGVTVPLETAAPFQGIRFSDGASAAQARFPRECGLGVRRTTLHETLISKAAEVGVDMHWGARINGVTPDGVLMDGREVRCRWLVGADGHNSHVRHWAGLESVYGTTSQRFGFRRHYRIAHWSEFVEVDWTKHGQLYITPTGPEEICVAFLTRDPRIRLEDAFEAFPEIQSRLQGAASITREQGAISAMRSLRRVYRGSCALIGEASGSVDAITGEGLSMIFQQAVALAQALVRKHLSQYQAEHRRISRLPRIMATLMLQMDRSPWLRARALHAFQAKPLLFTRMLTIHTGAVSPFALGVQETLSFGWHLVTA